MKRLGVISLLFGALVLLAAAPASGGPSDGRPNIVNIVTDDQTLSEMAGLPHTNALVGAAGAVFKRYYATYPLCCPARATLLTGRYAHNHGVRGNIPPNGGIVALNDAETVPVWLRDAGYETIHIGKYLNGYSLTTAPFIPPGWDEWYGKLGRTNGVSSENNYYGYSMYELGPSGPPHIVNYGGAPADYQTDVYRDKAVSAIQRLGGPGTPVPFYLSLNFGAPHFPYTPAPRDIGTLRRSKLPKLAAFNERDLSDKPRFMRLGTRAIPKRTRRKITLRRKLRLEQLRSVDTAVHTVVQALSQTGELDNTYIIFSSDNGYFFGEHKIFKGKYLPHEPSSRVPVMMRGPGIPPTAAPRELTGNIDIAPTIVEMAGPAAEAEVPANFFDGRSMLPYATNPALSSGRPLLLEGDRGTLEGEEDTGDTGADSASIRLSSLRGVSDLEQEPFSKYVKARAARKGRRHADLANVKAPAYRAIRTDRFLYVRYADSSQELYDLLRDPAQMRSAHKLRRYHLVKLFLRAQLDRLEACRATVCRVEIPAPPEPLVRRKKGDGKGSKGGKGKGKGGKGKGGRKR
jgi:arylsulfatase A-like enzyme